MLPQDVNDIVISGLGVVSPFGIGLDALSGGLAAGRSCVKEITAFDLSRCRARVGADFEGYEADQFDDSKTFGRTARCTQFAIISVSEALRRAAIDLDSIDNTRVGLFLSSARGAYEKTEKFYANLVEKGPRFVNPLLFQESVNNAPAAHVSLHYGFTGPCLALTSGGVGTTQAMAMGRLWLMQNKLDYALIVSTEALTQISHEAYSHAHGHAPVRLDGVHESCPFDQRRNGFVFGEGAVTLVMERQTAAQRRGVEAPVSVAGIGIAHDGYGVAKNDPHGSGIAMAMQQCLQVAGREADDVDWILAAANSSPVGDRAETRAIKRVFATAPPVTSLKSVYGELEGAAVAMDVASAMVAMSHNTLLPTINYQQPDPECDLDYVADGVRDGELNVVMLNGCSFGGGAGSVLLHKVD